MTQSRFPWKSFFHRSATAVFVLGPNGRLRYANPAWETLTGKPFAALRGTRISAKRESASPLWKVLAPPPEAWAGTPIHVRRSRPEFEYGPPWWDVQFVPLKQPRGYAVIGFVSQVGETPEKHAFREPEALASARAEHAKWYSLELFGGSTPVVQRLRRQLQAAAESKAPVWIHGPAGSGKETAARVIHQIGSQGEKPFVTIDCKALQPYMIEQLVFGRGGFAGSKAVGTLLLKYPELLPQELQIRFLEWSETNHSPRFVSCAHGIALSYGESLVPGFFAKLSALEIELPALKNRLDELPQIVQNVLRGECDESVWPVLRTHPWQNNIRELRSTISDAFKMAAGGTIQECHLPQRLRESQLLADSPPVHLTPIDEVMNRFERRVIETALGLSGGKPAVAAERLGMTRAKLLKRMIALGIEG
jgi:DNA-binding NtrC family response regulator